MNDFEELIVIDNNFCVYKSSQKSKITYIVLYEHEKIDISNWLIMHCALSR